MAKNQARERTDSKKRMPILQRRLGSLAFQNGADFFGVADLNPVKDFMTNQGGDLVAGFPRGVSIGIRISDTIVDSHSPDEKHGLSLYWWHVYSVVTPMLDVLAQRVQQELMADGFSTLHVPGSMPYNRKTLKSLFPHKLAAHLSGLGWIGKSCLLITPEFGPRVRFVTVLTDAPLEAGESLDKNCGKCTSCIEACPVGALKGLEFKPEDPVEKRFDIWSCEKYRSEHPCGLCVAACPFGRTNR